MRWILLLLLAACAPLPHHGAQFGVPIGAQVIREQGTQSGIQRFTVQEREIYRNNTGIMTARPVILQAQGHRAYAVLLNVRRRAPNGPTLIRVATGDRLLDYRRHHRIYSHCIDGCQRAELGAIHISADAFHAAARDGLHVLAEGVHQSYSGTIPAHAFARVLRAADDPVKLRQIRDVVISQPPTEP
ncbi:hypothetical protein [Loktanella sp. SALINAS62]|uniref:hypothetical protein n=1 Tax=Loktanella sp. SALINAS62 TaxID=2706124 RepID=UPI001B8B13E2|nr:hypothetical protein [Loktanella sp. SALINAS62]MBS1304188.1 hypothetical protein [Loktanella sp. SALINAS62]